MFPYEDSEIVSVCLSQIPLRMSYTLAKACPFCIPSQFVALCNSFRSGNQRHGNLVAEHELRQAATRICRATCMRIQGATRRCDKSRATCMLVCTRLYILLIIALFYISFQSSITRFLYFYRSICVTSTRRICIYEFSPCTFEGILLVNEMRK